VFQQLVFLSPGKINVHGATVNSSGFDNFSGPSTLSHDSFQIDQLHLGKVIVPRLIPILFIIFQFIMLTCTLLLFLCLPPLFLKLLNETLDHLGWRHAMINEVNVLASNDT